MIKWTKHDGKSMPVSPKTRVHVKFRDGTDDVNGMPISAMFWGEGDSSNWLWLTPEDECPSDIVAYRVVLPQ